MAGKEFFKSCPCSQEAVQPPSLSTSLLNEGSLTDVSEDAKHHSLSFDIVTAELPRGLISAANSESRGPASRTQLAEVMSHFLKGQGCQQALSSSGELLPMLQSVCGQVSKLRLEDAAAVAETERKMRNGTW